MTAWADTFIQQLAAAGVADAAAEVARMVDVAQASPQDVPAAVQAMAQRRAQGEPLAYVLGCERFMGLALIAAPGALAPRAETEVLGHAALAAVRASGSPTPWVIDMCCGSGNLACALAHHVPLARVWASDLTDGCIAVTRRNVAHLGLAARVTVAQGDLFAGLQAAELAGQVDVVVCNPPYISQGKLAGERAALLSHEPREAFDGGPYGLSIHQRVIKEALPFLKPGGVLLFEIGQGQERQVRILFERAKAYDDLRDFHDAAHQVRAVSARKRAE
ncbi:MAG: hypothetical protein RLZZ401_2027 [Pseudomonadota bacterium]|jgi:release factor glutamine methyltransferase